MKKKRKYRKQPKPRWVWKPVNIKITDGDWRRGIKNVDRSLDIKFGHKGYRDD